MNHHGIAFKDSWTETMIPSKTHSFLHCLGFNLQRTQGSVDLHAQCSTHQPEMVLDNNTNTRSSLSLKNCIVNIDFKLGLLRRNPSNVGLRSLDLNTMVCHLKLLQKPQHPANNTRSRFARPLLPESHFYWTKCPKPQKIASQFLNRPLFHIPNILDQFVGQRQLPDTMPEGHHGLWGRAFSLMSITPSLVCYTVSTTQWTAWRSVGPNQFISRQWWTKRNRKNSFDIKRKKNLMDYIWLPSCCLRVNQGRD